MGRLLTGLRRGRSPSRHQGHHWVAKASEMVYLHPQIHILVLRLDPCFGSHQSFGCHIAVPVVVGACPFPFLLLPTAAVYIPDQLRYGNADLGHLHGQISYHTPKQCFHCSKRPGTQTFSLQNGALRAVFYRVDEQTPYHTPCIQTAVHLCGFADETADCRHV